MSIGKRVDNPRSCGKRSGERPVRKLPSTARVLLIMAMTIILTVGGAGGAMAAVVFQTTQVTNNTYADYLPQVSGDRVAWYGYDGTDTEIYTWAVGDSSPTQLTDNSVSDDSPQVSGDRVVWRGQGGTGGSTSDYEIFTWALGDSSPTQITINSGTDYAPQVSGDRVVWYGNDNEIYTWAVGDTSPTKISSGTLPNVDPQVSGDRVVWRGYDGSDNEMYTWAVGDSSPTQISNNSLDDVTPQVSGDRVVWQCWDGSDYEIYTWAVGDASPTQLTNNVSIDEKPQISADRVVWQCSDGSDYEIYTWAVGDTSPTRLTDNGTADDAPQVSGDRVVWEGSDGSDLEIYMAAPPLVSVTGVEPTSGSTAGGNYVQIYGYGFSGATGVSFGGVSCTSFGVYSDEEMWAYPPAHVAGTVQVQVTSPLGSSPDTPEDDYTYIEPATVTGVSPSTGPSTGGTGVTITGTGFTGTASVVFGGAATTSFTIDSDTQISVTSPSWWWGGTVDVTVKKDGVESTPVGLSDDFTYVAPTPAETFVITQVTDNTLDEFEPKVDGERIVWVAFDGNDEEIFTWTPDMDDPLQLTDNTYDDWGARVSGNRVVWIGYAGPDDGWGDPTGEIFTWTPSAGTVRLTNNSLHDRDPEVHGNRIVWEGDDGSDDEIFTWTPSGGVAQITNNAYDEDDPEVHGDRVAWEFDDGSGSGEEIFTWTPSGGVLRVTDNSYDDDDMRVFGDRIVWEGSAGPPDAWDEPTEEIFTWTPSGVTRLTDNSVSDSGPEISGDRVVWERYGDESDEIWTWTPGGGTVKLSGPSTLAEYEPRVSGDRVVWLGEPAYGKQEVATWTPVAGNVQITDNSWYEEIPMVSGHRVVWFGHDGNDYEIYTAIPAVPTVDSVDPLSGPSFGGTEVTIAGTNFVGVTGVTFGGTPAASYTVDSLTAITAISPAHAADTVQVEVTAAGGASADTAADDFTYLAATQYEQSDAMITYLGPWITPSDSGASGGSFCWSACAGAAAVVDFTGTDIALLAKTGPTRGKALISLDGGAAQEVDLYSPAYLQQQVVYQKQDLTDTDHRLFIECAGTKHDDSSGYLVTPDALQIVGSLDSAPTPTRYEQDDGNLSSAGSWTTVIDGGASSGSFCYAYSDGAALNVQFGGTYLGLLAKTGPTRGKALISLDGGAAQEVDFYSPVYLQERLVYSTSLLDDITHNLTITWTDTKNPAASAYLVIIDAFDVMGTLTKAPSPPPALVHCEQFDPKITYLGPWRSAVDSGASGGSFCWSASEGAAAVVSFTGTELTLLTKTGPTRGKASVAIDDGAAVELDLYSPVYAFAEVVFPGLGEGEHTLTIECAGTKHDDSRGCLVPIDGFEVLGSLDPAPVPTRYEQEEGYLLYSGSWPTAADGGASGGSFRYTYLFGGTLEVEFEGTYLTLIAKTGPTRGKALISLNGGAAQEVDFYSPVYMQGRRVYFTGLLEDVVHTVTIAWTDSKNPASSAYLVTVDALDVLGVLRPVTP